MFPMPGLWLFACFVMQISLAGRGRELATDLLAWLWVGTMWAGWAGCVWLVSTLQRPWQKCCAIAISLAWHSIWMSVNRDEPILLRYLIMFSGYAVAQSVAFRIARVPAWNPENGRFVAPELGRRQFAIVELLALTTVSALLITAIKRYDPPMGQAFFLGLPIVYAAFVTTAVLCAYAITSQSRFVRQACAGGVLASIVFGSRAIAELESWLVPNLPVSFTWTPYYCIHSTFAASFMLLAACGINNHLSADDSSSSTTNILQDEGSDDSGASPGNPSRDEESEPRTPNPLIEADNESPPSSDLLPFRPQPHK